jgi:formylglycine-generating enzyme required for sulfatase activity
VARLPKISTDLAEDPSSSKGDDKPVENISWYDAIEFCQRLTVHTGKFYTLPSEAQWEYACRAGTDTLYHFGDTITVEDANYYHLDDAIEGGKTTRTVGSYPPNAFGLYDMHGNVWEWCLDDWHDDYEGAPTDGSAWIDLDHPDNSVLVKENYLSR